MRRDLGLVGWQIRYEQRAFWRNRGRAFFTVLFPLMFLAIFASLYQGATISSRGNISYNDFFVPGILAYGVVTTTFVNMAVSTAILRDEGVLKRMQGTPLPRWAYVLSRIGSTIGIVAILTAVTLVLGVVAYNVHVRSATLPSAIVSLALGAACFTTLGIGIVRWIPNADAAPPIVNVAILPLTFISGVWFVTDNMPSWLRTIADAFPIRALADALQTAFDPRTHGAGFRGGDLLTLAIWTVVGTLLMLSFLRRPLGEE